MAHARTHATMQPRRRLLAAQRAVHLLMNRPYASREFQTRTIRHPAFGSQPNTVFVFQCSCGYDTNRQKSRRIFFLPDQYLQSVAETGILAFCYC